MRNIFEEYVMNPVKRFLAHCGKPQGRAGRWMVRGMNFGHKPIASWGLAQLDGEGDFQRIGEFGCGGGANVQQLLHKYPGCSITAVDFSDICVQETCARNQSAIDGGRLRVIHSDIAALQLPAGSLDLITAFETVYFWPEGAFANVHSLLRAGGLFLIVQELEGGSAMARFWEKWVANLKVHTADELTARLRAAGFARVEAIQRPRLGHLCIKAWKEGGESAAIPPQ